jgi:hypothetical protein
MATTDAKKLKNLCSLNNSVKSAPLVATKITAKKNIFKVAIVIQKKTQIVFLEEILFVC